MMPITDTAAEISTASVEYTLNQNLEERILRQNKDWKPGDNHMIERLIDRRRNLESRREEMIDVALDRAVRQFGERALGLAGMSGLKKIPLRWCSVVPFFAHKTLCSAE